MKRQIVTLETMQDDHRTWLAAHAEWWKDIARWQAEHESAVLRLAAMQARVVQHGEALEEHARAMRQIEEAIANHEREIAKQQTGTNQQPHDVVANHHQEREGAFSRHKDVHERIGKHHEAVMAQLRALEDAAEAGM